MAFGKVSRVHNIVYTIEVFLSLSNNVHIIIIIIEYNIPIYRSRIFIYIYNDFSCVIYHRRAKTAEAI